MEDPGSIVQHPSTAAAVSSLVFSHSKRFLLYGSTAGRVRVTPLDKEQGRPLYEHWEATLHDSQRGAVRGAVMSFDDNYLLTVSEDGSFYVNQVQSSQLRGEPLDGDEWELSQDERGRVTEVCAAAIQGSQQHPDQTADGDMLIAPQSRAASCRHDACSLARRILRLRTSRMERYTRSRKPSRRRRRTTWQRRQTQRS